MTRIFLIILVLLSVNGCLQFNQDGRHSLSTPTPLFLNPTLKNYAEDDSDFSDGYRHGCNTALGIMGTGMLRMHGFEYDVNRGIENKEYYRGYRSGMSACTYHIDTGSI